MSISIILVDDHPIMRLGVAAMLRAQLDCQIVAECDHSDPVIEEVKRHQPDLIIVDPITQVQSGSDLIQEVLRVSPATRVLVLSMYGKEGFVIDALRSGAVGFVVKDSPPEELLRAIHDVLKGRRYLCAEFNERAIEYYLHSNQDCEHDLYQSLTPREREVLKLIADGLNNNEIAAQLEISPRTAEIHRLNMMHKLNINSLADLVKYAIRRGITRVE